MSSIGNIVVNVAMRSAKFAAGSKGMVANLSKTSGGFKSARTAARMFGQGLRTLATGAMGMVSRGVTALTGSLRRGIGTMVRFGSAIAGITSVGGIAGIGFALRKAMDSIDAIGKASTTLGVPTRMLMQLDHAAKITGTDFKAVAGGFKFMEKNISEAATGVGEAKDTLDDMGLSAEKLLQMSPGDMFLELADAIARTENPADRVRFAMDIFGRSGVNMVNMLSLGRSGLAELADEADRLGGTLGGATVRGVEAANDSLTNFRGALAGMATQGAAQIAPFIQVLADNLTEALINAKAEASDLTAEFGGWGAAILGGVKQAQELYEILLKMEILTLEAHHRGFAIAAGGTGQLLSPELKSGLDNEARKIDELKSELANLEGRDLAGEVAEAVRKAKLDTQLGSEAGINDLMTAQTKELFDDIERTFSNWELTIDLPSPDFSTRDIDDFADRMLEAKNKFKAALEGTNIQGTERLKAEWVELAKLFDTAKDALLGLGDVTPKLSIDTADLDAMAAKLDEIKMNGEDGVEPAFKDLRDFVQKAREDFQAQKADVFPKGQMSEFEALALAAEDIGFAQEELKNFGHEVKSLTDAMKDLDAITRGRALTEKHEDPRKGLARDFADIMKLLKVGAIDAGTARRATGGLFAGLPGPTQGPEALIRGSVAEYNASLGVENPWKGLQDKMQEQINEQVATRQAIQGKPAEKVLEAPP